MMIGQTILVGCKFNSDASDDTCWSEYKIISYYRNDSFISYGGSSIIGMSIISGII